MRFLIDRGIRGSLEIRGDGRSADGLGLVFEDPEVAPADWTPRLRVLSLDIETDPSARRLLAIGLHGCGVSEVMLLTPEGWTCPAEARPLRSERELLTAFARRVRELDPDVLTGWNVVDFDLSVLARIAERLHVALELGRGTGGSALRPAGCRAGRPRPASRPRRARRHPPDARRLHPDGRLRARRRRPLRLGEGKTPGRRGQGGARSCASSRRTARGSRIQPHRRPLAFRSSSGSGWSRLSVGAAADRPAPDASPGRSPPSTSSSLGAWDGAWSPACGKCRAWSAGRRARVGRCPASTRTWSSWTSRACTQPHPHVRDRPPEPRAAGSRQVRRRSDRRASGARVLPPQGHPGDAAGRP